MLSLETLMIIGVVGWVCWNTTRNVKRAKDIADSPLGRAAGHGLWKWLKK